MNEKQITEKIVTYLRGAGFWVFKVKGGPMQMSGVPDLLACRGGQLYAFEVKRPGGRVSAIQRKRLDELEAAGAKAAVVTSVEEVRAAAP